MADYSVVGKRMPKIDGKELVCGTARFTEDLILPKMICGKVLHSPIPHGKILNIDTSRALKLPGVKAVISGRDIAPVKFGCFRKQPDQYALVVIRCATWGTTSLLWRLSMKIRQRRPWG